MNFTFPPREQLKVFKVMKRLKGLCCVTKRKLSEFLKLESKENSVNIKISKMNNFITQKFPNNFYNIHCNDLISSPQNLFSLLNAPLSLA